MMSAKSLSFFILGAALIVAAAHAKESTQERNKKVVTDFYEMAFNQHKPTEAAKKFFGAKYIQHNPNVPNGPEAFYRYFEPYFQQHPQARSKIYETLADGDLVAIHVHSVQDEKDLGRAVVDIFRLENGKIVEHWDVVQPVPEKTVSGNSMFGPGK